MFDIKTQPLITEVRCTECRAFLRVDSDHKPTITRAVAAFQRRHKCRSIMAGNDQSAAEER